MSLTDLPVWAPTGSLSCNNQCLKWSKKEAGSVPQAKVECPLPRIFMRPSSLGGGRIMRRTLSVRLSVRPSRYRCHRASCSC